MARRRVFRTRIEGSIDASRNRLIGRKVLFQRATESEVNITADGAILGTVKPDLGRQIAAALDRGQAFTITVEKTNPMYDDHVKEIGTYIDITVEYLLEKGDAAIEAPTAWRAVDAPPRSFFTKIAGVSHEDRQRIVGRCSIGESLKLVREPDNPKDPDAIKILRSNGDHLGYVRAEVADGPDGLASGIDNGESYECTIKDITGGGDKWLGVNIEINQIRQSESYDALVQRRLSELAVIQPPVAVEVVEPPLPTRSEANDIRVQYAPAPATTRNIAGWLVAAVIAVVVIVAFLLRKS